MIILSDGFDLSKFLDVDLKPLVKENLNSAILVIFGYQDSCLECDNGEVYGLLSISLTLCSEV